MEHPHFAGTLTLIPHLSFAQRVTVSLSQGGVLVSVLRGLPLLTPDAVGPSVEWREEVTGPRASILHSLVERCDVESTSSIYASGSIYDNKGDSFLGPKHPSCTR